MLLAAYVVAGFTVAGVYAVGMLRGRRDRYHRIGLLIPLTVAAVAIPLQIVMGDVIARYVFDAEPAKFAAIEAAPDTRTHAPEVLGGILVDGKVQYGVPIPDGASLLSGFSPDTKVKGLDAIPADVRPPDHLVSIVHLSFDVMVGTGFALFGLALWFAWLWWRSRAAEPNRWFLRAVAVSGRRLDGVAGVRMDRHRGRPTTLDRRRASPHHGRRPDLREPLAVLQSGPWSSTPGSPSAPSTRSARCDVAGRPARRPRCRTDRTTTIPTGLVDASMTVLIGVVLLAAIVCYGVLRWRGLRHRPVGPHRRWRRSAAPGRAR